LRPAATRSPGEEPGAEARHQGGQARRSCPTPTSSASSSSPSRATTTSTSRSSTPTGSRAYETVSGQNSNNTVSVTDDFLRRRGRRDWNLTSRTTARSQDRQGPRPLGEDRLCGLGVGRSRSALQHHDERLAHLPGRRPHPRLQPVLGVHVPRRHGLQPGLAEPAEVLRRWSQRGAPRRRGLRARLRLWTIVLEISV
jgi:hypothetical protein